MNELRLKVNWDPNWDQLDSHHTALIYHNELISIKDLLIIMIDFNGPITVQ